MTDHIDTSTGWRELQKPWHDQYRDQHALFEHDEDGSLLRVWVQDDGTRLSVGRLRDQTLDTAKSLVSGDREQTYGDATESFTRIATLWTGLLGHPVTASDVARCMVALKLSRLHGDATHADSWIDIAGYAALGSEIAGAGA